jgi:hypothetical protein
VKDTAKSTISKAFSSSESLTKLLDRALPAATTFLRLTTPSTVFAAPNTLGVAAVALNLIAPPLASTPDTADSLTFDAKLAPDAVFQHKLNASVVLDKILHPLLIFLPQILISPVFGEDGSLSDADTIVPVVGTVNSLLGKSDLIVMFVDG